MRNSLKLSFALLLAACGEPYTVDSGAGQTPVVVDIIMRDGLGTNHNLATPERNATTYIWDGSSPIFAFNFPYVRFNKLMDGNSMETTAADPVTGRKVGNCGPTGSITLTAGATPVSALRVCYSPSDKLVSVQPSRPTMTDPFAAFPYMSYSTNYTLTLSSGVKDWDGRSISAQPINFSVRPFELLRVTNYARSVVVWGAPDTKFEPAAAGALESTVPDQPEGSGAGLGSVLRLVFSGPVAAMNASLNNIKIYQDGQEVKLSGETEVVTKPARLDPYLGAFSAGRDTRVVYIMPPHFQASNGEAGLPPGEYELVLPTTVTDDGTVTGTPVPLQSEVRIPFEVAEAE